MNYTGPRPNFTYGHLTHKERQSEECNQTASISVSDTFVHLLMSRGETSGADIQAGCLLTYAWFFKVMVVCSLLEIIVK